MTRCNHIHRHIHCLELFDLLFHKGTKRGQDIGIILDGFLEQFALVDLVIVHCRCGIMLAEGIIGKQKVSAFNICEHAVRPVQHRGFHKDKLVFACLQCVTRLYLIESPVLVMMAVDHIMPVLCAIYPDIRYLCHEVCQASGMV